MTEEPMPENTELTEARSRTRKVHEAAVLPVSADFGMWTNEAASPRTAD
jgi:hypothetical protein